MKNESKAVLKPLKDKLNSRCQNDKKREDAEQKHLSMTPCLADYKTTKEVCASFGGRKFRTDGSVEYWTIH